MFESEPETIETKREKIDNPYVCVTEFSERITRIFCQLES